MNFLMITILKHQWRTTHGKTVRRPDTISQVFSANTNAHRNFIDYKPFNKTRKELRIFNAALYTVFRQTLYTSIYCESGIYLSVYTCYLLYAEKNLQLLGKSRKLFPAKCMHSANMHLVWNCYSGFVLCNIRTLYIHSRRLIWNFAGRRCRRYFSWRCGSYNERGGNWQSFSIFQTQYEKLMMSQCYTQDLKWIPAIVKKSLTCFSSTLQFISMILTLRSRALTLRSWTL